MADMERWVQAQSAEREHECHQGLADKSSSLAGFFPEEYGEQSDHEKTQTVFALGSGMGPIHSFTEDIHAIGVDPIYESLTPAESDADVIAAMGEQIPLLEDSVDYLICHNVLDHVMNPRAVAVEIRRLLEPSGKAYIRVNTFQTHRYLRRVADRFDRPHPHHFTNQEVFDLLVDAGLDISNTHVTKPSQSYFSMKSVVGRYLFNMHNLRVWVTPDNNT
jgi:SAM-dependent methyltransferase